MKTPTIRKVQKAWALVSNAELCTRIDGAGVEVEVRIPADFLGQG